MEIIKVSGFKIISKGNPLIDFKDVKWELQNNFYFDNQEELQIFKKELKSVFNNYCGDVIIETFEEMVEQNEINEQILYSEYPVRYLIRDKDHKCTYKQVNLTTSYSSDIGTAIHFELPHWINENDDVSHVVIKSTDPEFKKILFEAANNLEKEISDEEFRLSIAKNNLELIKKELKHI
jgi:hypothetical protein